mgnify:CR=1 FL=1
MTPVEKNTSWTAESSKLHVKMLNVKILEVKFEKYNNEHI